MWKIYHFSYILQKFLEINQTASKLQFINNDHVETQSQERLKYKRKRFVNCTFVRSWSQHIFIFEYFRRFSSLLQFYINRSSNKKGQQRYMWYEFKVCIKFNNRTCQRYRTRKLKVNDTNKIKWKVFAIWRKQTINRA